MELLKITHFGPVKDLNVEILPLTVFIGTQGCGKSTVSKVLTICRATRQNYSLQFLDETGVELSFSDKLYWEGF